MCVLFVPLYMHLIHLIKITYFVTYLLTYRLLSSGSRILYGREGDHDETVTTPFLQLSGNHRPLFSVVSAIRNANDIRLFLLVH